MQIFFVSHFVYEMPFYCVLLNLFRSCTDNPRLLPTSLLLDPHDRIRMHRSLKSVRRKAHALDSYKIEIPKERKFANIGGLMADSKHIIDT